MATVSVNTGLLKDMASFIKLSSELVTKQASLQQSVNSKIPEVVDTLIRQGLIEPIQKEAAIAALADPVKALETLKSAARRVLVSPVGAAVQKEASAPGKTESEKMLESWARELLG